MLVVFNISKEAALFKILDYLLSCFVSVHACILRIIVNYLCVLSKNVDNRQVMSFTDFKVVRVMGRSDLYNACTKLHINIAVGNDRYLSANKRQSKCLAYDILISFVLWIYCNGSITEKCFRTCCSKLYISASVCKRIFQMPEVTSLIFILNLCV